MNLFLQQHKNFEIIQATTGCMAIASLSNKLGWDRIGISDDDGDDGDDMSEIQNTRWSPTGARGNAAQLSSAQAGLIEAVFPLAYFPLPLGRGGNAAQFSAASLPG